VGFDYCMRCEPEQPCFKVVDCWWETFDIVQYLKDHLPDDLFGRVMDARPKSKIAALVAVAAQAKQRLRE
jgi:glutathione S-transferase